jgi:outer membrane protein TolC
MRLEKPLALLLVFFIAGAGLGKLRAQVEDKPAIEGKFEVEGTLTLEKLLDSVERSYPTLLAVLLEKDIARAKLLAALGKFDLKVKAGAISDPEGYYSPNRRYSLTFEQPTTLWGTTFFGGWRRGTGLFEPYYGDRETLSDGEFSFGVKIPLLRDGATDANRTALGQARIEQEIAELVIDEQWLSIIRAATRRYWDWVAAGKRLAVSRDLLAIAERRKKNVQELVDHGDLPKIENVEIQRIVLERKGQFISAERALQNAAIELSLYYRTAGGDPIIAEEKMLPQEFAPVTVWPETLMQEDAIIAIMRRPEVKYLMSQKDQAKLELKLQQNRLLPNLDFTAMGSRDFGRGSKTQEGTDISVGLQMEIPLQRREAEGKIKIEEAKIAQIDQKIFLSRDRIKAEVRDAYIAVKAAHDRARLAHEELILARQLEEAERVKFEHGDSTQFIVNLRELQTADAAIREIAAQQEYHRAVADYRAAAAIGLPDPK